MNSKKYVAILADLKKKIKQKHLCLLSSGVILQHDNSTPPLSKTTTAKLVAFSWSVFLYPTYFTDHPPVPPPNLAPSDYQSLLSKTEAIVGRQTFANEEELKATMLKWFLMMGTQF